MEWKASRIARLQLMLVIFFEFFCMMRFYLNLYVVRSEKRKRFRLFRVLYNLTFKGINPLTDLLFFKNI